MSNGQLVVPPWHLPGLTEKNYKTLRKNLYQGSDKSIKLPKYETISTHRKASINEYPLTLPFPFIAQSDSDFKQM
jgi:hypothetical protein